MPRSSVAAIALLAATLARAQSVEGLVVNSLTGDPLGKAHVTLRRSTNAGLMKYGAISDAAGKFSVKPIAPGTYELSAALAGFLMPPGRPGETTKVEVGRDAVVGDLRVKLVPHGILTGRVIDANGDPMERINVQALHGSRVQSEHVTDANGEFRIAGLPAGRYLVRAEISANYQQGPEIRTDGSKEEHYASTWYPNSLGGDDASFVEARAGQEVGGVDIHLQRSALVRVSGAVTGMPQNVRSAYLNVSDFRYGRSVKLTGASFTLWGLPRGKFRLHAFAGDGAGHSVTSAEQDVEVSGSDVDNLTLAMLPPFEVTGRISWDGDEVSGRRRCGSRHCNRDGTPYTPGSKRTARSASPESSPIAIASSSKACRIRCT